MIRVSSALGVTRMRLQKTPLLQEKAAWVVAQVDMTSSPFLKYAPKKRGPDKQKFKLSHDRRMRCLAGQSPDTRSLATGSKPDYSIYNG